jgi:dipeptidyl aminopeptidase/acylaminoacyl peptidase
VTLQFGYLPQRRYSEARELAFKSSPVSSIANWRSPVLLVHGDDDRNVPFQQTTELVEKLRAQNVESLPM